MTDLLEIVESPNKHNSCTPDENKEAVQKGKWRNSNFGGNNSLWNKLCKNKVQ